LTQNIDNLESKAGFTEDEIIQAHGANVGASCAKCRKPADRQVFVEHLKKSEVMYCDKCGGPIKPDIVFFGENLPQEFYEIIASFKNKGDLLIVMGTALAVGPFNQLVNEIGENCPKVLINMENTAYSGFDFEDADKYPERLFLQGKCDEVVTKLAKDCGWEDEFAELTKNCKKVELPEAEDNQIDSTTKDIVDGMDKLNINDNTKEETKEVKEADPDESGPFMGFFAVEPKKECPHCTPEFITPMEEFADITINTPCYGCGHTKENWVCMKTKVVGCSRYVNSCMVKHNEKFKNPIALSFADFSFWCYECDSYVISKHLNHVKHFYPQKFGAESASHM